VTGRTATQTRTRAQPQDEPQRATLTTLPPSSFFNPSIHTDQDNIYHAYAQKQQAKELALSASSPSPPFYRTALVSSIVGFGVSKLHSRRALKAAERKHQKDQKTLYSQYYNDVYKMQEAINICEDEKEHFRSVAIKVSEASELDAIQRDYDEFKQPDIDGDDRISRPEFNMYVKNYLSNYPGLGIDDYPKFEDFDHDQDGFVSFSEYAQQMAFQVKQAEWEAANGGKKTTGDNKQVTAGMQGLLGEAQKVGNFQDLYANYR
jgi:hypothetical protein